MYELADGSEVRIDVALARIEFMGEFVGGTIVFGDADAEPLLGVTALESAGIEIDPQNQRLKKLPAIRLKNLRIRSVEPGTATPLTCLPRSPAHFNEQRTGQPKSPSSSTN